MPKLRIFFTGLLGYVEGQQDGNAKLTVVSPAISSPILIASRDPSQFIALPHFTFLSFRTRFLGASRRLPDLVSSPYGASEQAYGVFIGSEHISVNVGSIRPGVSFYRHPDVTDGQEKPNEALPGTEWIAQRKDYRWILNMGTAMPGCGTIDSDCLGANSREVILSRIELLAGELTVNRLAGEREVVGGRRDANVYRLEPLVGVPEVRRALAEEVLVELDITNDAGEVRFASTPIGTGQRWDDLVLKSNGQDIECRFLNVELDQIVRPRTLVFDSRNARDFVAMYDLCRERPPLRGRRFPSVFSSPEDDGGPAGDRICPGGFLRA